MLKALLLVLTITTAVRAQDAALARDFYVHGLKGRALESFIELLHSAKSGPVEKAEALYYMGQIAFDENSYVVAMNDWQKLIKEYPTSKRAVDLKDRLVQLREVFSKATDASIESLVARSYIRNGDFWSDGDKKFLIDSSWLSHVDLAVTWYDRVIKEFPGSDAAEIGFQRKMFALLGWREVGRDGEVYGAKGNFRQYMPAVLKTFTEFESAFPKSAHLQGFRYQIAQAYWGQKDWENTRTWLNKILEAGTGDDSFYTETAKARLKKIEY
jgi:tetratricopeptide (TPR) repeat protein